MAHPTRNSRFPLQAVPVAHPRAAERNRLARFTLASVILTVVAFAVILSMYGVTYDSLRNSFVWSGFLVLITFLVYYGKEGVNPTRYS